MKGQTALCQVCVWQDRDGDDPAKRTCTSPHAVLDNDTCSLFLVVAGDTLGYRLAELVNMIEIAWDVIMAMLVEKEQLPRARLHEPLSAPGLFRQALDAEELLDECNHALAGHPDLSTRISQWKVGFDTYLTQKEVIP